MNHVRQSVRPASAPRLRARGASNPDIALDMRGPVPWSLHGNVVSRDSAQDWPSVKASVIADVQSGIDDRAPNRT